MFSRFFWSAAGGQNPTEQKKKWFFCCFVSCRDVIWAILDVLSCLQHCHSSLLSYFGCFLSVVFGECASLLLSTSFFVLLVLSYLNSLLSDQKTESQRAPTLNFVLDVFLLSVDVNVDSMKQPGCQIENKEGTRNEINKQKIKNITEKLGYDFQCALCCVCVCVCACTFLLFSLLLNSNCFASVSLQCRKSNPLSCLR